MKQFFFIGILLANIQVVVGQEIEWLSWNEMMERQETERKKVFIDVYTDWCGWCKKMDASTFKDPQVVAAMNANYYAVKLDAEMHDTIEFNNMVFTNLKPNAKRGVHALAVSLLERKMSYPSFVILDENYVRTHIISGFQKVPALVTSLNFFGLNQHVRYQQYLSEQQKRNAALQQAQSQNQTNEIPQK